MQDVLLDVQLDVLVLLQYRRQPGRAQLGVDGLHPGRLLPGRRARRDALARQPPRVARGRPCMSSPHHLLRAELTNTDSSQRTCSFYFPQQYTKSGVVAPTVNTTNTKYQGWGVRVPRLFFGTGRSTCSLPYAGGPYLTRALDDPWKESTAASDYYSYPNTTDHPVGLGNGALTPCARTTGAS
jgi:hypothetical protein